MFPVVADDGSFGVSRQAATVASSASGLKGFCRLRIAPSFVAIARKSGPSAGSTGSGRPEITTIGIDGRARAAALLGIVSTEGCIVHQFRQPRKPFREV